jgi:hypothetical protein
LIAEVSLLGAKAHFQAHIKNQKSIIINPLHDPPGLRHRLASILHRDCFACGGLNAHGLKLHFEVDANGVASAVWQPSGEFLSYADRVHGGIIATLLDSSMVHALFAQGVAGVTAELTIRYLQGVNIDDPIQVSPRRECKVGSPEPLSVM